MTPLKRNFPRVLAQVTDGATIRATGREGATLLKLISKGPVGVRAFDFDSGPAFRLGAYVFDLRGMGLSIRTDREDHATGWHAVYVLETPVTILAVDHGDGKAVAA
jgi:hypothetical protein